MAQVSKGGPMTSDKNAQRISPERQPTDTACRLRQ